MIKSLGAVLFGLGLLVAATGHNAIAQDTAGKNAAQGVFEACEPEIKSHCKEVTPGEGRIFACMYAYEDKLSKQCSTAIDDFADALDFFFANARQALAICAPDIEAQCSETAVGGGRVLTCLSEKQDKVGAECKEVIEVFSEKFGLKEKDS
ncbi:cysteine rich repeat-containing protein [Pseudovibrio sp. Ad37]|uniref:cysteine rich repeat-containing protein n=1 Tax=Pseudovibrio sp. Ad37 TaxID=989422 RepID=UPI0007AECA81|nr:cysteine rich repeat-containing protein [Pseudovibrio sp. Ad37]KZL28577.1 Cysteine rich repeat protein [Pseudovibrio sp. Ad37]